VPLVAGLFYGIKPAVAAIVLQAAAPHRLARAEENGWLWAIAAQRLCRHLRAEGAVPADRAGRRAGRLAGRPLPAAVFRRRPWPWPEQAAAIYGAGVIDDDTPTPNTRASLERLALVLGCGAVLWLLPWACWPTSGWQHTLTQMGWFFTKAALLTFRRRLRGAALCLPGRGGAVPAG
jgi:chromate transporter